MKLTIIALLYVLYGCTSKPKETYKSQLTVSCVDDQQCLDTMHTVCVANTVKQLSRTTSPHIDGTRITYVFECELNR